MDTKKLRQKILDLAIHGKLVPQDPNDEPASVLLERIKAEKEQLIKEGKIKRQKKSASSDTSHYGNEVPFEVPEGWVWCRLKDITSFLSRGKSPQYSEERKYPVFAQKCNLKGGGISLEQARFLAPETINRWGTEYKLRTGDVLINSTGTGTVGRTRIFNSNCLGAYPFVVPDSHVSVVRTFKEVNPYYIYMLISSKVVQEYLEDNLAGSTNQKELYIGVLEELYIPLPPMDEQDRIVMKSNKLFLIIDCIEKEEENLSVTVQKAKSKILEFALSGKFTSDTSHYGKNEWKSVRISDICTAINGLWTGKKEPFVKVGVIRNANFTKDFNLDYSKIALIDVEVSSFAKRSLMAGDLIVEKSGGSDKYPVGRAILYEGPDNEYSFSNFTMVLRPKEVNIINSKYLYYSLMNRYLKGAMRTMQTQTTGLHNLILDKFMSQTIALPPIEEQVHIVENISHYFSILDSISSSC